MEHTLLSYLQNSEESNLYFASYFSKVHLAITFLSRPFKWQIPLRRFNQLLYPLSKSSELFISPRA